MDDDELDGLRRRWGKRALSTGRIAASAARLAARRVVGREGVTDAALGETLARELDQMKGMAMKVGQILSYFDGVMPEEAHRALQKLQQGQRAVAFDKMRTVIEDAFAARVEDLFDDFDDKPVAAASIGQVYRAHFAGEPVAVKVQYPGIKDTIDADFSRLRGLSRVASLATAVDGEALVRELQEAFDEECDYLQEAAYQRAFQTAFADDATVAIPTVIDERSRSTVLTTSWAEGADFYSFTASAPAARRDEVGLLLARFAYRSLFGLGALNADPHPGNYLFPSSGAVVFLDFGCVRVFTSAFLATERELELVILDDRRSAFRDAFMATGVVTRPDRFDFDLHWQMMQHQLAPYRVPRFTFTGEYVQRALEFNKPSNPNLRLLAIPPPWIWLQRLQWGLHAVLARLGASGDFREVLRAALAEPTVPLALPTTVSSAQ